MSCQKYSGFVATNKPGKSFTSYQKHPSFVAADTAGNVLTSRQKYVNFLAINTAGKCPELGRKKKKKWWFHPYKCWNALLKSSGRLCNLRPPGAPTLPCPSPPKLPHIEYVQCDHAMTAISQMSARWTRQVRIQTHLNCHSGDWAAEYQSYKEHIRPACFR